jgi:alkanesulfonate monooxygenase SsuD/methylene tetrahydromethanopterin reductase-like flavin-dependent oxidoreductase (luciferase family)
MCAVPQSFEQQDTRMRPRIGLYDITVLLAEAAARTTRITLGTGILGIWSRSAATLTMAAATLSRKAYTTRRSGRRCRACAG